MYSDNPRYYQPPPPQSRQSSYTTSRTDLNLRRSSTDYRSAPPSHGTAGRGRYGNGLGVTHNPIHSPTPQRAPSGRMRAWADDDEILSGNTAQTGFQPAPPPHHPTHLQRQQQQQWGHIPRHSLAGALSPGPGSGSGSPFTGQSRSDLPASSVHAGHSAGNNFLEAAPPQPAHHPPAQQQLSSPASWYNTETAHDMHPVNPSGTKGDPRRSSLARSNSGTADTSIGHVGDRRASNRSKNKRKNKRMQGDEGEVEERIIPDAAEKGTRRKNGPPPKAKLGGPGGWTYEERQKQKNDAVHQETGELDTAKGSAKAEGESDWKGSTNQKSSEADKDAQPMYKNKPIEVRLPPSRENSSKKENGGEETMTMDIDNVEEVTEGSKDQVAPAEVPLPTSSSPSETQSTGPFDADWDGKAVKVALPTVPEPAERSDASSAEAWQPGPISQRAQAPSITDKPNLDAPLKLELSRRDTFGTASLSPVFASPALGNEDLGASPSTLGRTRENSTSEYQATISRAAFLRPSAPAFMPASRIFQRNTTSPAARNEINELPTIAPVQSRVVSDTSSDGPRKKLRPSAPAFTPSHASGRSRTPSTSSIHSRLSIAAKTFSPKRGLASLSRDHDSKALLVEPSNVDSTPGPSSRPSMTKVAQSPSPVKGTLRAAAPSFMPVGEGSFTFKPPATNKGRPSLISAFEPPSQDEIPSQSSSRSSPGKDPKAGYLGGLGSGMSLPVKNATIIEASPLEPETSIESHKEAVRIVKEQVENFKASQDRAEDCNSEPDVSPVPPSEDTFGSMRASELFFRPTEPTPAAEKDDIFSASGTTPIVSAIASDAGHSRSDASRADELAARHKPEQSYDSEAGQRSGYVEDLGDFDEDYSEEVGHVGGSDIEPDNEELNGNSLKHAGSSVRAHLPTESFGLPSPVNKADVRTVGGPPIPLPTLQHVPRYIPADQPSSPTTPVIPDSPLQNQPTGPRLYRHFDAPETPHKTVEGEQDAQISASPTPARRISIVRRHVSPPSLFEADFDDRGILQEPSFAESQHSQPLPPLSSMRDDRAADDTRFRTWVFPTPDKIARPSIERRYTMPLRDIATAPAYASEAGMNSAAAGVASTLQERVSELRDVLGGRGDASYGGEDVFGQVRLDRPSVAAGDRKPSVEFPPRPKTLKVVNATPKRQSLAEYAESNDRNVSSSDQEEVFRVLTDLKLSVAEMTKRQAAEKDSLETRQILATIEGMRGDMLDMSHRRGREHEKDNHLRHEMAYLRQQLSEQKDLFQDLSAQFRAELLSQGNSSRPEEMFTALLSGQHAMLNKFTAFSEERDLEADQLAAAVEALSKARVEADKDKRQVKLKDDVIHALRQQLAEAKATSRRDAAELVELHSLRDQRNQGDKAQQREMDTVLRKIEEVERARDELDGQLISAKAKLQAAESERDAIAEALGEAHGSRELLERQMVELRHKLDIERSKPAAPALNPQIDVSAQVGELFSANKVFQDDLFAQIAFLQKDIVEAREANVEAVEEMMSEKVKLRERIQLLESELDEAKSRATQSEIQAITESEHNLATMTVLDSKLSTAIAARDSAEARVAEMEEAMVKLRHEKENAQIVAMERSGAMRHAEARLAALAQENVYWRQFALSYDRREYRKFLGTQPFKDANGQATHGSTGDGVDHDATINKKSVPVQSPVLQTPHANAEGAPRTFLTPSYSPLKDKGKEGKEAAVPSTGMSSLQATPDLSASTSTALSTRAPSKQ